MNNMIQQVKNKRGGFTLVELIVVLVILALLAAILVPTLTGYINKAKEEKDYQTAQTVRVAAQAVADDQYAFGNLDDYVIDNENDTTKSGDSIATLSGAVFDECHFNVDDNGKIVDGYVTIDEYNYYLNDNEWSNQAPITVEKVI